MATQSKTDGGAKVPASGQEYTYDIRHELRHRYNIAQRQILIEAALENFANYFDEQDTVMELTLYLVQALQTQFGWSALKAVKELQHELAILHEREADKQTPKATPILTEAEFIARLKNGERLASIAGWFQARVAEITPDLYHPPRLTPFDTWFQSDLGQLTHGEEPDVSPPASQTCGSNAREDVR
jgi:hypothetical protein